ncbi:hypothetical protein ACFQH2_11760 [Natronoarchaeum sp. GCM10025703]|uniref:DUF7350 domain-containing protein n=1 Tax=unclassified Natronoarchaeum TaxID=2620183 RepID=UPI0036228E73
MKRRTLLQAGLAVGSASVAGCLGVLETESVWQSIPVVEDRPDAVYLPAGAEEMATYGVSHSGDYGFALQYTFPHRFYNITEAGTKRVDVQESDAMHLMVTIWDRETGTVLPAEPQVDIYSAGSLVTSLRPWAMISQRMGFHYGDNVQLAGKGTYTAEVRTAPINERLVGDLEDRLRETATTEIEFEYDVDDIYDLSFEEYDESERGRRDAAPLMNGREGGEDGGHDEHDMHAPVSVVPAPDTLPGRSLGTASSSDAVFAASLVDGGSRFDVRPYLLISLRTPYNRVPLPEMSLTATGFRDGEAVFSDEQLSAALDPQVDFHYGLAAESLETVDTVRIDVTAPPGVLRHDGYETAFLDIDPVEFSLED